MSSYTAAQRLARAYAFEREIGLAPVYVDAAVSNPSASLAGHGAQHLLATGLRAADGGEHYGLGSAGVRALFIAGLFHDADYTVGAPEDVNIPAAEAYARQQMQGTSEEFLTHLVVSFIRATRYPHYTGLRLPEEIIGDADLLCNIEPDAATFHAGLASEGIAVKSDFPSYSDVRTGWARGLLAEHRTAAAA